MTIETIPYSPWQIIREVRCPGVLCWRLRPSRSLHTPSCRKVAASCMFVTVP